MARQFIFSTRVIEEVTDQMVNGFQVPRHMNPWWKNKIGIRKAGLPFAMTKEEQQEYIKCASDIKYYAEKYCKIKLEDGSTGKLKLRPYQKEILDLINDNRFTILMASRQVGKTISTAISILHYVTFNNNKNVMIMANKRDTVIEIIDKIKNIYQLLPFFLKPAIGNWNQGSITFEDNKCRILSQGRSKEPAIGFTIDFLYMDEFAHIPNSILRPFYRAIFPTVSNIENSKIVITSTPNGFNMFHELLTKAELPEGDINKNGYSPMRVYWYDVPNRNVTYIWGLDNKMMEQGVSHDHLEQKILSEGWVKKEHKRQIFTDGTKGYWKEFDEENQRYKYTLDNPHKTQTVQEIRQWRVGIKNSPLPDVAIIETWMEKAIKDIGGEANFKQEYEIQFLTDGNGLLEQEQTDKISKSVRPFTHTKIDKLEKYLSWDYQELLWDFDGIGEFASMHNNYHVTMIDLAEGLGQDYTVFNTFRVLPMEEEEIDSLKKWDSVYDFFKLKQVGIWRSNIRSIDEAAKLFYVLNYEVLDPERSKFTLEWNTYGSSFIKACKMVWDMDNDFGTFPFVRYEHSYGSGIKKVGYKMTGKKPLRIKDLQKRLERNQLQVMQDYTFAELRAFSKKEMPGGSIKYQSETGHDDITMTMVGGCSIFDTLDWKVLVDEWMLTNPDNHLVHKIENKVYQREGDALSTGDYSGIVKRARSGNYRRGPGSGSKTYGLG